MNCSLNEQQFLSRFIYKTVICWFTPRFPLGKTIRSSGWKVNKFSDVVRNGRKLNNLATVTDISRHLLHMLIASGSMEIVREINTNCWSNKKNNNKLCSFFLIFQLLEKFSVKTSDMMVIKVIKWYFFIIPLWQL